MTDSSSPPPEPPNKPPTAPRRIPRSEAPKAEAEGRDKQHVGQRVMEQRPHERKPTEHAASRGKRPDLRDLPAPRRDTPSNVWRADPPPAPPRARQDDPRDRRDGPRRAHGDAPRPDRPGERRTSAGPWQERGPRPDFPGSRPPESEAPRAPFRKDDRRATGVPPGPPRDDHRRRDDRAPQGHGHDRDGPVGERPRAPYGDRGPSYPQGPNERPRYNGPRDDNRGSRDGPRGDAGDRPRAPGPNDRPPPPRRRDDFSREAPPQGQAQPPQRPAFDPNAPRREDQRLSKVLAERGIASRREADDWIDAGWVKVDGEMAVLGARVFPHQVIEIDEAARTQQAHRVTILLHKPIGYVSGQAEDGYEPASVLVTQANHWPEDPSRERWHPGHARGIAPAGRLDIDSTGLLVLTQDGRIARHLIGEDSDVEKEYLVRVEYPSGGQFPDNDLDRLRHGLWLDGKELRPAKVSWANEDQLRFVLREGRKRQIRRMCEAVGLVVTGLKRVRIGSVVLGKLPPGQWRYLREDERF
jgi:23S rRNA pseudouridine2604 synthase